MKRIFAPIILLGLCLSASAQETAKTAPAPAAQPSPAKPAGVTVIFKDGRSIVATALKREGNAIMATLPMPAPAAPVSAQPAAASAPAAPAAAAMVTLGYQVSTIAKIEFPEPPQLKTTPDLLLKNRSDDAIAEIDPIVKFYEPFKDVPGNWWSPAALLKLNALVNLKRDSEMDALIAGLLELTSDPEAVLTAQVQQAASWIRRKDYSKALPVLDTAIKNSKTAKTLAAAWLNKGHVLLAKKQYEPALIAYLHLPVFYPDQKLLMPAAVLGSARAYNGIKDEAGARRSFSELITDYPNAPESSDATVELKNLDSTATK